MQFVFIILILFIVDIESLYYYYSLLKYQKQSRFFQHNYIKKCTYDAKYCK